MSPHTLACTSSLKTVICFAGTANYAAEVNKNLWIFSFFFFFNALDFNADSYHLFLSWLTVSKARSCFIDWGKRHVQQSRNKASNYSVTSKVFRWWTGWLYHGEEADSLKGMVVKRWAVWCKWVVIKDIQIFRKFRRDSKHLLSMKKPVLIMCSMCATRVD